MGLFKLQYTNQDFIEDQKLAYSQAASLAGNIIPYPPTRA